MAATITIRRLTGAGPSSTDITGINTRANAYDGHSTNDTSNPIQIPAVGTNYSYWVVTQLSCDVTPSGTIDNLRWYTSGSNPFGTGVTVYGQDATGYVQATGVAGTGTQLTVANYADLTAAPVEVWSWNSGSPKSVTGSITNPNTGAFGNRMVYQINVADTASPGVTPGVPATFTWKYDET